MLGVSVLLQRPFSGCKWSIGSEACSDGLCIFTAKWSVGRYPIAFSSLFDGHLGGFQVGFLCCCFFFALMNSAAVIILEAPGNLGIWI